MLNSIKSRLSSTSNSSSSSNNNNIAVEPAVDALEEEECVAKVFDIVASIRDPEKPNTLSELEVVRRDLIEVEVDRKKLKVGFSPTIPHCSLATLIGLCLKVKIERSLRGEGYKLDLYIEPGKHQSAEEITKQINDKERVAAAMENPKLIETVESCITEFVDPTEI